jgi:hypothetical protein
MTTREHQDADPVVDVRSDEPEISDDPDEIRQQIDQTRAELGETVEALAAKADVKAQVKEKVATAKEQAQEKAAAAKTRISEVDRDEARQALASVPERVKSRPLPAVLAAGGLFLTWMIRRRRRAR